MKDNILDLITWIIRVHCLRQSTEAVHVSRCLGVRAFITVRVHFELQSWQMIGLLAEWRHESEAQKTLTAVSGHYVYQYPTHRNRHHPPQVGKARFFPEESHPCGGAWAVLCLYGCQSGVVEGAWAVLHHNAHKLRMNIYNINIYKYLQYLYICVSNTLDCIYGVIKEKLQQINIMQDCFIKPEYFPSRFQFLLSLLLKPFSFILRQSS